MLLESYCTWWHLKALIVYTLTDCAIPWWVIWNNTRLKPDPKRDIAKYQPWVRADTHEWSYVKCIFTHFFFIPRYACLLIILAIALIGCFLISFGAKLDNLGQTRRWLILQYTCLCMRLFLVVFGVPKFSTSRPKVDYSKWLGPDWKPNYEGATMMVANHQSWYDIFSPFLFVRPMPGFVAKDSIKTVPSVGAIATAIGSVFLDRRDKDQRRRVFEIIQDRQERAEKGEAGPILIFPEGCSTNGESLIQFKKGAFASLKPVKPWINRASCSRGSNTRGDLMGLWHWSFLIPFMNGLVYPEVLEMPVFAPNDFFWNKYWDGKNEEDKWKIFAQAVREAMAECGGFKLSDSVQEDKMEFKNLVWGKAFKDD